MLSKRLLSLRSLNKVVKHFSIAKKYGTKQAIREFLNKQ